MRIHNRATAFLRPGHVVLWVAAFLLLAATAARAQYGSNSYNSPSQYNYNNSGQYNQYGSNLGSGSSSYGGGYYNNGGNNGYGSGSSFGGMGSSFGGSGSSFGGSGSSFGGSGSSFGGSGSSFGSSGSSFGGNRDLNRESRSRSRSNSSTSRNGKGGKNGTPAKASAQGKSTVVKRKGGGKEKGGKGGAPGIPLPEIKIDPQQIDDAIYLSPTFHDVRQGDRFASTLNYFNHDKNKVTKAALWVHYDPEVLAPIWVDLAALKKLSAQAPQIKAWPDRGYIEIQAEFKTPLTASSNELLAIHWRAVAAAAESTWIELAPPPGEQMTLLAGDQNVLEPKGIGNNRRVSAQVRVHAQGAEEPGLVLANAVSQTLAPPPTTLKERLHLAIFTPDKFVGTGEQATADVMLLNPTGQAFDDLRFRIRYDPTAVKILDSDEDNYISSGINIYDGQFHEKFPFDYHLTNHVDLQNGVIEYHVASSGGPQAYPSGTVARIVYKMTRQAGQAAFWFEQVDPASHERVTDVTALGRSLLGDSPATAADALHGMEVAVRPLAMGQSTVARPLVVGEARR